jgi:hypothetical protein
MLAPDMRGEHVSYVFQIMTCLYVAACITALGVACKQHFCH